jgi:ferredoxin
MRVSIDEDGCIGAGQCVLAAPDVFDQREDDGVVIVLDEEPAAHLHEATREAALLCPAAVIRLAE